MSVHVDELRDVADGRCVRALENGRAFVHLVEHRHIEHLRPGADGRIDLIPVELAALARDARQRLLSADVIGIRAAAAQVVPAESGIHERNITHAVPFAPLRILHDVVAVAVHLEVKQRCEALDHPGKDQVRHPDEGVQIGVRGTIGAEVPPIGRDAQHHRAAAVVRIVVQEVDELRQLDLPDVIGPLYPPRTGISVSEPSVVENTWMGSSGQVR